MEPMKPNEEGWRMEMKDKSAPTTGANEPKFTKDCKKNTEK